MTISKRSSFFLYSKFYNRDIEKLPRYRIIANPSQLKTINKRYLNDTEIIHKQYKNNIVSMHIYDTLSLSLCHHQSDIVSCYEKRYEKR